MKESNRLWWLIGLLLVLAILYFFRTVLAYVVIAAVIGFAGDPVVSWLRRLRFRKRQLPRWLCAGMTLSAMLAVTGALLWMFAPLVAQEVSLLASLDIQALVGGMQERWSAFSSWLDGLGLEIDSEMVYTYVMGRAQSLFDVSSVTGMANDLFGWIGDLFAAVFSILFMSFFFLKDGSLFYKIVFAFTPDRHMERMKNILSHSHRMLSRYFGGLFVQVVIMTAMVAGGLYLLGIQNALLIGVFAGLANVIPYVGPLIAAVFGMVVGITTGLAVDPDLLLWATLVRILAVFGAAQFIDNWVVQPFILGSSVNAHPLELFIVLLAAGTAGGILAMAIALPVYTILRIVAREYFTEFKVVESWTRDLDGD